MNSTIRTIQQNDNLELAKMIRQVFVEHIAPQEGTLFSDPTTDHLFELFQEENSILWVLEIEGKALGCCGLFPTQGLPEKCVELVKFYISKEARGNGFGLELMNKCIESAIQMGYKSIYIESLPEYAKAVNMYLQTGFKQLNQSLGTSGHTACNLWFLKELDI
jgi:putative acetyltransferase